MTDLRNRSSFVPLLVLVVLCGGALAFACGMPMWDCASHGFPEGKMHLWSEKENRAFWWVCRDCDGAGKVTFIGRILRREDGVLPPDAVPITFTIVD